MQTTIPDLLQASVKDRRDDCYIGTREYEPLTGRITHNQRVTFLAVWETFMADKDMTEKEKLFADFFNQGVEKCNQTPLMSFEELDVWLDQLEKIVLEGKATIQAVNEHKRKRIANLSESERDKLLSKSPPLVSDALNAVKKRKDRMSKADKLFETLTAAGMSDEDARKIAGNIKPEESSQPTANKIQSELGKMVNSQAEKIAEKAIKDAEKQVSNAKPFDPTALFGSK